MKQVRSTRQELLRIAETLPQSESALLIGAAHSRPALAADVEAIFTVPFSSYNQIMKYRLQDAPAAPPSAVQHLETRAQLLDVEYRRYMTAYADAVHAEAAFGNGWAEMQRLLPSLHEIRARREGEKIALQILKGGLYA